MTIEPSIFADTENDWAVYIRVEGKGTFGNSPCLRDFAVKMIEENRRDFVIDLSHCPSMDSTFMGILAGIAMRLTEVGGGNLWVTNMNERNADLLDGLGISALFSDAPVPLPGASPAPVETVQPDKATTREVMREAHEACVKVNPANAEKFRDVLEHLADSARRAK